MNITQGSIVRSKAGRDKDKFLVVAFLDGKYAYVCDGKERPIERPKKKNLLHLSPTSRSIPVEEIKTNRELKTLLKEFNS